MFLKPPVHHPAHRHNTARGSNPPNPPKLPNHPTRSWCLWRTRRTTRRVASPTSPRPRHCWAGSPRWAGWMAGAAGTAGGMHSALRLCDYGCLQPVVLCSLICCSQGHVAPFSQPQIKLEEGLNMMVEDFRRCAACCPPRIASSLERLELSRPRRFPECVAACSPPLA